MTAPRPEQSPEIFAPEDLRSLTGAGRRSDGQGQRGGRVAAKKTRRFSPPGPAQAMLTDERFTNQLCAGSNPFSLGEKARGLRSWQMNSHGA